MQTLGRQGCALMSSWMRVLALPWQCEESWSGDSLLLSACAEAYREVSNFTHFMLAKRRGVGRTDLLRHQHRPAMLCSLLSTVSKVSFYPHPVVCCCCTGPAPQGWLSKPQLHVLQQALVPHTHRRFIFLL